MFSVESMQTGKYRTVLGISQYEEWVLKNLGNWTSGRQTNKRQIYKLSTTDEQYLKVILKKPTKSLTLEMVPVEVGCQEAILKEVKAEVCQIKQELD